jgi:hypothetical protein
MKALNSQTRIRYSSSSAEPWWRLERPTDHHSSRRDAINHGRKVSQNQGAELRIHNQAGKIRQSDSHGRGQTPPKGLFTGIVAKGGLSVNNKVLRPDRHTPIGAGALLRRVS